MGGPCRRCPALEELVMRKDIDRLLQKRLEMTLAAACYTLVADISEAVAAHDDEALAVLAQRLAVNARVLQRASRRNLPEP